MAITKTPSSMTTPLLMVFAFILITIMYSIQRASSCDEQSYYPSACDAVTSYLKPCTLLDEKSDAGSSAECCEGVEDIIEYNMYNYNPLQALRGICACIQQDTDLYAVLDKLPEACDNSFDLSLICS
ncbi:Bifunctional inhibitor/lipid-transfer protein/seed storage 2S albumin protein [Dioscorea alata]|uniref:Bifunctional inhibitor/lipid-transfer protein/seed storage 2S albumin protein n=1 Tax=Dioscorea alata TaxID=55571 RepID=A0ACB7VTT2_DIOAL|nr:Bifunctional inhibitor/lipid-transfer protein/seed storage 2S albumin protein [Dioscorea alata]